MKIKTHIAVKESYTLVNKSEAFLACIKNLFKVYVIYNKYNKIAFLNMPIISRCV